MHHEFIYLQSFSRTAIVKIDGVSTNENLLFIHIQNYKELSIAYTDLNLFPYTIFLNTLLNYRYAFCR